MLKGNVRGWGEEGGKMAVWGGGGHLFIFGFLLENHHKCVQYGKGHQKNHIS